MGLLPTADIFAMPCPACIPGPEAVILHAPILLRPNQVLTKAPNTGRPIFSTELWLDEAQMSTHYRHAHPDIPNPFRASREPAEPLSQ